MRQRSLTDCLALLESVKNNLHNWLNTWGRAVQRPPFFILMKEKEILIELLRRNSSMNEFLAEQCNVDDFVMSEDLADAINYVYLLSHKIVTTLTERHNVSADELIQISK